MTTSTVDTGHDPRTGLAVGHVEHSTPAEIDAMVARAARAADASGRVRPSERARWLDAAAEALERHRDELASLADSETALGMERLLGEVTRTAGQLRLYGAVVADGAYLHVTIDAPAGGPRLTRVNVPVGVVAVFGASNFPFAFSAVGNDTGSAIAAGCAVVVKAHPAHPLTSRRTYEIAAAAMIAAGAPDGILGLATGFGAGTALVRHDDVAAVAFTGSQAGGLALWRMANERETVIPVYAEMGTVNPVVVTPSAAADIATIADGLVASFTLGSGQFCTKPGLVLAPLGSGAARAVADALDRARPRPVMLTEDIARSVMTGVAGLERAGATVVTATPASDHGWSAPAAVLEAPLSALQRGSRLLDEVFGPVAVVAEYDTVDDAVATIDRLQGALAASLMVGDDDPDGPALLDRLYRRVGRVVVNGWPTGVAFTWAQQHGGPWPSTTNPAVTSVGAAAVDRFVRPVAWQGVPDAWLPPAVQDGNPWEVPRRVDGVLSTGPFS